MADGRFKASSSDDGATTVSTTTDLVAAENPSSKEVKVLEFSGDEETLIIRMYNLVGDRWSLIAGRIPGRSAEEIEKYWNSRDSMKSSVLDYTSNDHN